jgi:hypothetical protein
MRIYREFRIFCCLINASPGSRTLAPAKNILTRLNKSAVATVLHETIT